MAYSIDWSEVVRHIAVAIDKILKGVNPAISQSICRPSSISA